MTESWKETSRSWFHPLARRLAERNVTPDAVTIAGFVLSLVAALLLARGSFLEAAFVLALTGLCDMLDGDIARIRGATNRFGAFLDSTLDRAGEGAIFGGLATYYFTRASGGGVWFDQNQMRGQFGDPDAQTLAVLTLATLLLSFLVSYTRARAEGLGLECKVGIMERPERLLGLMAGALLGHRFMPGVVGLLFLLTLVTVLQRVYHVRRLTRPEQPESATARVESAPRPLPIEPETRPEPGEPRSGPA